jgi:hypothetical protein
MAALRSAGRLHRLEIFLYASTAFHAPNTAANSNRELYYEIVDRVTEESALHRQDAQRPAD